MPVGNWDVFGVVGEMVPQRLNYSSFSSGESSSKPGGGSAGCAMTQYTGSGALPHCSHTTLQTGARREETRRLGERMLELRLVTSNRLIQ